MYNYIFGKITEIESTYITVEAGGIGYLVYTPNPYSFDIGEEKKVFVYQVIREDENSILVLSPIPTFSSKIASVFFSTGKDSPVREASCAFKFTASIILKSAGT